MGCHEFSLCITSEVNLNRRNLPRKNKFKNNFPLFSEKRGNSPTLVLLNSEEISPVDNVNYLTHMFQSICSDSADIFKTLVVSSGLQINQALGGINFSQTLRVMDSKVIHMYGCMTWRFDERTLEPQNLPWRPVLKMSASLPLRTRTSFLHSNTTSYPAIDCIHHRNVTFLNKLSSISNQLLHQLFIYNKNDTTTVIGFNLQKVASFQLFEHTTTNQSSHAHELWEVCNSPYLFVPGFLQSELRSRLLSRNISFHYVQLKVWFPPGGGCTRICLTIKNIIKIKLCF